MSPAAQVVRSRSALLPALAALVPLAVVGPLAVAQQPVGAAGPPLAAGAGASLAPGEWRYVSSVTRGGSRIELSRRTLTIHPTTHGGADAWLVLDVTEARGQTMTDSLLLTRADLRPLRRVAQMGPVRLTLRVATDSVVGTAEAPGAEAVPIALALDGAAPLVSAAHLEAVLRVAPLAPGWRATVSQLTPVPTGATLVPVTLEVAGEESVATAQGAVAAWIVVARAGEAEQRLWIARDGGVLLRHEAVPPQSDDVRFATELVGARGASGAP